MDITLCAVVVVVNEQGRVCEVGLSGGESGDPGSYGWRGMICLVYAVRYAITKPIV